MLTGLKSGLGGAIFLLTIFCSAAFANEKAAFSAGKAELASGGVIWASQLVRSGGEVRFGRKALGPAKIDLKTGAAFVSGYGDDAILQSSKSYIDLGFGGLIQGTGSLYIIEAGRTTFVRDWVGRREDIRAKPDPYRVFLVVNNKLRKAGEYSGMAKINLKRFLKTGEFATAIRVSVGAVKSGKLYGSSGPNTTGAQIVGAFISRGALSDK